MNNTYYPYNEGYEPPRRRPPRKKGGAGVVVLSVLLAFFAGMGGSWVMNNYIQKDGGSPVAQNQPVTMQTVATSLNAGDYSAAASGIIAQVADVGKQSIVEVTTESRVTHPFLGSYVTGGAGSGIILTENGYIITNDHVISGSDTICVRLPDGELLEAALVGTDPQTDLAVLKVNASGLTPVVFADSDSVTVGELAVAIGNPLGTLGGTVTEGVISARDREIILDGQAMVLLQTSAAISPGNSGGGLFDQNGHLVGVVNAKSGEDNVEGIGFAIPANTAKEIATALIENGYVPGRPVLGVEATTASSYDLFYRYNASQTGVYITETDGGSGLARGDQIVAVNGIDVSSVSEMKSMIGGLDVGDTVELTVVRNGRRGTLQAQLRERGANDAQTVI